MNAVLAPALGQQRESDAQRRIDAAVRFAVWACAQEAFPRPPEIQREFGVSRRTAGRWRKSLALAMRDVATPRLNLAVAEKAMPHRYNHTATITDALLADALVLELPQRILVRDIRARFPGCTDSTALRAINDAKHRIAVGSAPHGTPA